MLVTAGVACFVVGVAIVFLLARDDKSSPNPGSSSATVPVLFAKEDIKQGTTGADAVAKVEVKQVAAAQRAADSLSSASELSTQLVVAAFGKGEQIRQGGLKRQSGQATSVPLAAGKEAVAVAIPFVPGGAGYVAAGNLVNVYQVIPDVVQTVSDTGQQVAAGLPFSTPRVELLLTNVRVLEVQAAGATPLVTPTASNNAAGTSATTASQPTGSITVILEVDTLDAEKVIFGTSAQKLSLYLTRVGDGNAPAGPTPGRDYTNQFQEEPNAAFSRTNK
ncbi:MAG: pilus assembly protein CpaB [Acidimicrobiaceae bacterium]